MATTLLFLDPSSLCFSSPRVWLLPVPPTLATHLSLRPALIRPAKKAHGAEAWLSLSSSGVGRRIGFSGSVFKCSNSDASIASSEYDLILLDVEGMSCGGCTSSVKKILESQQHVVDASVFLDTKSAEVKVSLLSSNSSKKEIGEALAKHLSNCGFTSHVRETSA